MTRHLPTTTNDEAMTRLLSRNFAEHFGTDFDPDIPTTTIAEDFSILATSQGRPCVFWHWGGIEEGVWDEHAREGTTEDIPANHTSKGFKHTRRRYMDSSARLRRLERVVSNSQTVELCQGGMAGAFRGM